jgi:hypothetical protein
MNFEADNRMWTHHESPEGKPSAAAYRLGCRCAACVEANAVYMRDYRARRVIEKANTDGTAFYHSHVGQPSKRTSRTHMCVHPRCLDMAGLRLDENGVVCDAATGIVDATWGVPITGVSVEEALAALRAKIGVAA